MGEADCTTCYTVADFSREYQRGVYVLGCSGHVLTVIDGAWWKNNSFTTEAIQADAWMDEKKKSVS